MLGLGSIPSASEPCCSTHCAVLWEPLEFLTNVNEIIKIYGPTDI